MTILGYALFDIGKPLDIVEEERARPEAGEGASFNIRNNLYSINSLSPQHNYQ